MISIRSRATIPTMVRNAFTAFLGRIGTPDASTAVMVCRLSGFFDSPLPWRLDVGADASGDDVEECAGDMLLILWVY